MEAGFILAGIALSFIAGCILGMRLEKRRFDRDDVVGTLHFDSSDPNNRCDVFSEFEVPLTHVVSRDYVIFKVNLLAQNSQK